MKGVKIIMPGVLEIPLTYKYPPLNFCVYTKIIDTLKYFPDKEYINMWFLWVIMLMFLIQIT